MKKTPFHISASKENAKAVIRITGEIGWDTDAELFRAQVDALIALGIQDVHIYINSPGGSCFDANEIVNIISRFEGTVTGEGGSLVASAASYISLCCDSFIMPENGMYMIHKPSGWVGGTANDISSYLNLLNILECQYLEVYKAKATNEAELLEKWNSGDWWLTAKEAKNAGFITDVKEKTPLNKEAAAIITACGCPKEKLPEINTNKTDMDLKQTAVALGLPESATAIEINAAIAAGKKAQADLIALEAETKAKEADAKTTLIKAVLDKAIEEKRISADMRANWEKMLAADFDIAKTSLEALAVVKKLEVNTNGSTSLGKGKVTHQGKTFEELQEEDSEVLAGLQKEDPKAYDELFNDYKKRNKL